MVYCLVDLHFIFKNSEETINLVTGTILSEGAYEEGFYGRTPPQVLMISL